MDQQKIQLMSKLVEIQKDNMELRRELLRPRSETPYVKTPERLSIGLDTTESEWTLFVDRRAWYKTICGLTNPAVIKNELRAACTADANRLLFELIGPDLLNSATEDYLFQKIWLVTIKGLHK